MTLIPAKHTIVSATALLIAAVIAAGALALPSLRAQSLLPAQGGLAPNNFSSPLSPSSSPLSPDGAPGATAQGGALPSALAAPASNDMPMMDDSGQPPLVGAIVGNDYVSPLGAFRIRIPIYTELGGEINDTENVVTFQDAFGEHYSIGAFPMNNEFRIEEAKRGHKDFLIWFFQNFILADFQRTIHETTAEPNARYNAGTQGGTLFTILNIPNGSVYMDRIFIFPPKTPVVAKRGNLLFVRDGFVYVLSTELSERVFEYRTWNKTATEEEEILRQRLYDLLSRMVFMKPNTSAATPAPALAPALAPTPASTGTSARAATPAVSSTVAMPAVTYPTPTATGTGGASVK